MALKNLLNITKDKESYLILALLVILILVIYMTFSNIDNERFIDSDNEIDVNKCNFVPWTFALKIGTNFRYSRDQVISRLLRKNIETRNGFYSPNYLKILKIWLEKLILMRL